jgi:two-component system NarL family sensor kinase
MAGAEDVTGWRESLKATDAEALERRNRELSILNAVASALNASVDLDESLRVGLSHVAELLGLRTGWVFLLDEETGEPYPVAAQNLPPGLAADASRMHGSCYCLDTYRQGDLRGAANVNVVRCSRLKGLVDGTAGLRYHASIPLYARGRKLGILNVASSDWRELSAEDLRLLYIVGDLLSIAIERARLYSRSVAAGAAEERNRLAREIHDTLAQGLAGIAFQLESAEALLDAGASLERVRDALAQALVQTRAGLDDARRSVMDLRAAPLEGRALTEALGDLVAEWAQENGVAAEFEIAGAQRALPSSTELGLFRIAQEALANVSRHAAAGHVKVELAHRSGSVSLSVEDDGRGFDTRRADDGHYGILGMNERAHLLGGRFRIKSSLGTGTRVEVEVPA